jgi:hypothetical protein
MQTVTTFSTELQRQQATGAAETTDERAPTVGQRINSSQEWAFNPLLCRPVGLGTKLGSFAPARVIRGQGCPARSPGDVEESNPSRTNHDHHVPGQEPGQAAG